VNAIIPTIPTPNRRLKKIYIAEAAKAAEKLEEINSTFLHYIFNAPKGVTYEELYQMFLEEWTFRVKWLNDNGKLKVCAVRANWFELEYKPRHKQIRKSK